MNKEPALIIGLVSALITLAVAFGLRLSAEQTAAIMAVVQIVAAIVVRSKVTPVTAALFKKER